MFIYYRFHTYFTVNYSIPKLNYVGLAVELWKQQLKIGVFFPDCKITMIPILTADVSSNVQDCS